MITGPITQAADPCDVCSGAGCLICAKTMGEHTGKCDPCPKCFAKDADFASLLEREPQPEGPELVELDQGPKAYVTAANMRSLNEALRDAAERIKSLEDVLVVVRGRASMAVHCANTAALSVAEGNTQPLPERSGTCYSTCQGLVDLVTETLDPCEPWCVLAEPGRKHEGACVPIEEGDRGE